MAQDQQEQQSAAPQPADVDPQDLEQLEVERAERLDPANRPADAEVDNTDRTFDPAAGRFTDDPEHDPGDEPFADGEGES